MGVAAAGDQVGHTDAVGGDGALWEQAQAAGDLFCGVGVDDVAVEVDGAAGGFEGAGQGAQQGGFSACVGADDDGEGVVGDGHVQVVGDHVLLVGQGQVVGVEACVFGCGGHGFLTSGFQARVRRHSVYSSQMR